MAPPICLVIPFYLIFSKTGLLDTFTGLTLAYLTFNLSFYIWVLRSFCRDLPVELEEVAMVEGYSRFAIFLRVVLPLLRSGIVSTAVLCFIFAWNEFLFAFMLGGQEIRTLPVAFPLLITTQGVRWGEMAIVGVLSLLPVLIAVFLLQKHIVRGLTMGAVKG
jgi:multiple sugar transport system permease protein